MAGLAQLVEQFICNDQVNGSSPLAGSSFSLAPCGAARRARPADVALPSMLDQNVGIQAVFSRRKTGFLLWMDRVFA